MHDAHALTANHVVYSRVGSLFMNIHVDTKIAPNTAAMDTNVGR